MLLLAVTAILGVASWFQPAAMYGDKRVCAMNYTPEGAPVEWLLAQKRHIRVKIRSLNTGRTAVCDVIGTGPFVDGRVIDVSPSVREDLQMGGTADVVVVSI